MLLHVKNTQVKYLVQGKGGNRIRLIAKAVEQELRQFFLNDARVTLVLREPRKATEEPSNDVGKKPSRNLAVKSKQTKNEKSIFDSSEFETFDRMEETIASTTKTKFSRNDR